MVSIGISPSGFGYRGSDSGSFSARTTKVPFDTAALSGHFLKATLEDYPIKMPHEDPLQRVSVSMGYGDEACPRTELERAIISFLQKHTGQSADGPDTDGFGSADWRPREYTKSPSVCDEWLATKSASQSSPEASLAGFGSFDTSLPASVAAQVLPPDDRASDPGELSTKVDMETLSSFLTAQGMLSNESQQVSRQLSETSSEERLSSEIKAKRDLAGQGGGLSGCTTVMLRHVPVKLTQRKLVRELNGAGFTGLYDFLYMPMDLRRNLNRGSAFVNFVSPEVAEYFYKAYHGKRLRTLASESAEQDSKVLSVMPADVQGFEQNALHQYAAFSQAQPAQAAAAPKPIFLRPLPPSLASVFCTYGKVPPPQSAEGPQRSQVQVLQHPPRPAPGLSSPPVKSVQKARATHYDAKPEKLLPPFPQAWHPQEISPAPAGPGNPNFCVFCGKGRQSGHAFCTSCGCQFF